MSQTNANGEILVLDSAGYGAFTIDRSVTVQAAPGIYAGVTASSGNAITLSLPPSGKAVIRGLTLEGLGTGTWGIYGFAGIVHIENCIVNGFVNGIGNGSYTVTISDTVGPQQHDHRNHHRKRRRPGDHRARADQEQRHAGDSWCRIARGRRSGDSVVSGHMTRGYRRASTPC